MKAPKYTWLIILLVTLAAIGAGCVTVFVSPGFGVITVRRTFPFGIFSARDVADPGRRIGGNWDPFSNCNPCSSSDVVQFFAQTGTDGRTFVTRGRAPSLWTFYYLASDRGPCGFDSVKLPVYQNQYTAFICIQRPGSLFIAAPDSLNVNTAPATLTLQTTDAGVVDPTYGMPVVDFFDEYGNVLAQATATSVSSDGSTLTINTPDLSACYTGTYGLSVMNAMADGTWDYFGSAVVDMYGNDPPPPDPDPTPDPSCWGYEGVREACTIQ